MSNDFDVKVGRSYKHYRGGEYVVIALATHSEYMEESVVYQSADGGVIWVRPLEMWFQEIKPGLLRFTLIEEGGK